VRGGHFDKADAYLASAQLAAGAAVAAFASVPVLFLSGEAEIDVVRFELAGLIGLSAIAVGCGSGASWIRSIVFAVLVVALASFVAFTKNALAGH
jgi:hypothetical protein